MISRYELSHVSNLEILIMCGFLEKQATKLLKYVNWIW